MGCFFKIDFFFIFHASSIAHLCAKVKRFYIVSKRFSNNRDLIIPDSTPLWEYVFNPQNSYGANIASAFAKFYASYEWSNLV
jgi:hypothetical protein